MVLNVLKRKGEYLGQNFLHQIVENDIKILTINLHINHDQFKWTSSVFKK